MTTSSPDHSEDTFFLIDHDGFRRVPRIVNAQDGRRGFAIHPAGRGNDTSAAHFTSDLKTMVQEVVLNGKGVRARANGGPRHGQQNTLGLSGKSIRGYWLHPDHLDWVIGGIQPEDPVLMTSSSHLVGIDKSQTPTKAPVVASVRSGVDQLQIASKHSDPTHNSFRTVDRINFSEHCCQGKGTLEVGSFSIDDLTMAGEGNKRLRFAPLGNRPNQPLVALVGITPGGQINKFADYLATMGVSEAASKAAFSGAQTVIKQLLYANGLAKHIGLSLEGDLNESHVILTTSIVKCCLMVDENYKFKAPDIAASPAARYCATTRLVRELLFYPTLKWVVVFGQPGWDALNELQIGGNSILKVLGDSGLKVIRLPHFSQNFQQRELYAMSDEDIRSFINKKPDWAKFVKDAVGMRNAVLAAIAASE